MPVTAETKNRADLSSWIEIRLDRFQENLKNIRALNGAPHAMAVIKANGYGHGLVELARSIQNQVTYLGVSSLYEVLELREHGIETPIFLFGHLFGQELLAAAKAGATLSISSYEDAQEIAQAAYQLGKPLKAHIKIDTGMGRLGIPDREALAVIEKIYKLRGIELEGIYTHFPTAEREDGFTESQFQKFGLLLELLETKGISFEYRHAANSAGSLKIKSPILNLIRPGLILYGINPLAKKSESTALDPPVKPEDDKIVETFQPVLSLKSRIILLKRLLPEESVGYGREFKAEEPSLIATLPIGYSHGYPVHLSGKSSVLFRGKRYPLAGRVSMDYLSVNLGNTPAAVGDEITLIGEEGRESLRAEELAKLAGTISYEIVTRLSPRLPRIYRS